MPTIIGQTRRVLLLVCDDGDDVSIRVQRPDINLDAVGEREAGGGF